MFDVSKINFSSLLKTSMIHQISLQEAKKPYNAKTKSSFGDILRGNLLYVPITKLTASN